ncbi:hypothetical protein X744_32440 [Mesorhizobium sp. LNJC372A00]|nr:hypothetical protein X745_31830 [Mesorhizobium sp. LNJC374B00]ESY48089.1 hypothetical protein X744_32440 [Mesorhizobium sp. LNJC372A00]
MESVMAGFAEQASIGFKLAIKATHQGMSQG